MFKSPTVLLAYCINMTIWKCSGKLFEKMNLATSFLVQQLNGVSKKNHLRAIHRMKQKDIKS